MDDGAENANILSPRKLAPVVPAPPWCNVASICGKSQLRRRSSKHADVMTLGSKATERTHVALCPAMSEGSALAGQNGSVGGHTE